MLNGSELRMTGKFTAGKSNGAQFANGAGALENNFMNRFAGVSGMIDNITISSKRLNSTIERVQNYNRLVPSLVSGLHGKEDIMGDLFHQGGSIYNNWMMRNQLVARDGGKGRDFSIPLYMGMLHSGADINLSRESGLSGLTIDILLKSDANVVWGSESNSDNATYNVSNLSLTIPLIDVSGETANLIQRAPPTMNFNTWSSIFTTINSSAAVVSLNPGLSRVSSCLYNALNSVELGDQRYDPGRLGNMGQLDNLRYTKNGVLFPLQYRIDTTDRENASDAQGGHTGETVKCRAVSVRNTIEGLLTSSFFGARHNLLAFNEFDASVVNVDQTQSQSGNQVNTDESYGILYDKFGSGTDFSTSTWAVELKAPDIDGTATTSQSLFVYFLNKNTVEYSSGGVNIIR
tara:strand:+ start:179 stop:1390 length:1212 start_codon:yes stop_codon:yes gene_type:complete